MTLLRRTVAEGSTLERWLRRKAAIGNITKGDSLYLCGHGETAPPLRGLFSSLTWAASVPPRRPHLLRASTVRAEGLTQPWAAAGSVLKHRRRRADNAPLSRPSQMRRVYWTLAGSRGDTSLPVQDHGPSVAQRSIAWRVAKDAVTKRLGRRHQLRLKSPGCGQVSGARLSQPVHR